MAGGTLGDLLLKVGANIDGFRAAMTEVSGTFARVGDNAKTFLTAMTEGFAFEQLIQAAETVEGAIANIGRVTGDTGPRLEALGATFKTVFADSNASASDLSSGLAILAARTGLTGDSLTGLLDTYSKLAEVTGQQVAPAIDATQKVFAAWGVDVKDQAGQLDALLAIARKGGITFSSLTGSMQSAGAVLRTMGVDFDTAASLLTNFQAKGLETDRVVAALKMGLTALSKEGFTDPQAAMGALIQKLVDAKDPMDALTIASQEFGKRGALYIVDAARQGGFAIEDFKNAAYGAAGTINETQKKTKTFTDSVTKLWHEFDTAIAPIGRFVTGGLGFLIDDPYIGLKAAIRGVQELDANLRGLAVGGSPGLQTYADQYAVIAAAIALVNERYGGTKLAAVGAADATDLLSNVGKQGQAVFKDLMMAVSAHDKALGGDRDTTKLLEEELKNAEKALGEVTKAHQLGASSAYNVAAAQQKVRDILAQLHPEWVASGEAITKAGTAMDKLVGPADYIGAALRNVGLKSLLDDLDKANNELGVAAEAFGAGRIRIEDYADAIEKAYQAQIKANPASVEFLDLQKKIAAAETEAASAASAMFGLTPDADRLAAAQDNLNKLLNSKIQAGLDDAKREYSDAFAAINDAVAESSEKQAELFGSLGNSMNNAQFAILSVDATLHGFGEQTVSETKDRIKLLQDNYEAMLQAMRVGTPGAAEAASLALNALADAEAKAADPEPFRALGIKSQQYLDDMAAKADANFREITRIAGETSADSARSFLASRDLMLRAGQDLSADAAIQYLKIQHDLENLNPTFRAVIAIENEVKAAGKDIASGIADIVTAGKNWADAFESIGQKIAHDIIEGLILKELKGVEGEITKLITKLGQFLGLIPKGGVLGTSVGAGTGLPTIPGLGGSGGGPSLGPGGDLGNLPTAGPGDVGVGAGSGDGGASGITGILTSSVTSAITGIVSAVSGIFTAIGTFEQVGALHKLGDIETNIFENLTYSLIPTLQHIDEVDLWAINSTLSDLVAQRIGGLWTDFVAFRADFDKVFGLSGAVEPVATDGAVTLATVNATLAGIWSTLADSGHNLEVLLNNFTSWAVQILDVVKGGTGFIPASTPSNTVPTTTSATPAAASAPPAAPHQVNIGAQNDVVAHYAAALASNATAAYNRLAILSREQVDAMTAPITAAMDQVKAAANLIDRQWSQFKTPQELADIAAQIKTGMAQMNQMQQDSEHSANKIADYQSQLSALKSQASNPNLSDAEKAALQAQITTLTATLAQAQQSKSINDAKLADLTANIGRMQAQAGGQPAIIEALTKHLTDSDQALQRALNTPGLTFDQKAVMEGEILDIESRMLQLRPPALPAPVSSGVPSVARAPVTFNVSFHGVTSPEAMMDVLDRYLKTHSNLFT
jgi:TP901 family phage tail tape measure protein